MLFRRRAADAGAGRAALEARERLARAAQFPAVLLAQTLCRLRRLESDPIPGPNPAWRSGRALPRRGPALAAGGTLGVSLWDLAFEPIEAIANRPRLVELAR